MHEVSPFDGALLVDKPVGPTSHDVVDAIRRRFGFKKVGHCGTLDPNATGLLVIVLGKGTKLAEKLIAEDKHYQGTIRFGQTTNTHDADGEVVATAPVPPLDVARLNELAAQFVGDLLQTPPMVSAVKKRGVPLYKLARKGIEIERNPRLVHVYRFNFADYREPYGYFDIACTKGTYVRTLAHEFGQKLGCGAHLASLRRIASGKLNVEDATPLDELLKCTSEQLQSRIIPFLELVERLRGGTVAEE